MSKQNCMKKALKVKFKEIQWKSDRIYQPGKSKLPLELFLLHGGKKLCKFSKNENKNPPSKLFLDPNLIFVF